MPSTFKFMQFLNFFTQYYCIITGTKSFIDSKFGDLLCLLSFIYSECAPHFLFMKSALPAWLNFKVPSLLPKVNICKTWFFSIEISTILK